MINYKLAPYVTVGFEKETLFIGFGSIQMKINENINVYIELLLFLKNSITQEEIYNFLSKYSTCINADNIVHSLFSHNLLIEDGIYDRNDRYSRQKLYMNMNGINPKEGQDKLNSKHIVILGCGGIGNLVSVSLVCSGIGKVTLVDTDTIEESNLTRQYMFKEDDINDNKIDVLERELKLRNSKIIINKINLEIKNKSDLYNLPKSDLIVLSADKPWALVDWVNEFSIEKDTPYINIGYVQDIATWGPFVIPGKTACLHCQDLFAETELNDASISDKISKINIGYQAPSTGTVNMLAASSACIDIMKYFLNIDSITSLNKRIGIWTHDFHIETQNCQKNSSCKTCGKI